MLKNLIFTSILFFSVIGIFYPGERENTELFDYCHSVEKILSRNSIQKRENISEKVKSLSRDISKYGVRKSRGFLMNKMINKYKASKSSYILKFIPNKIYCLSGYWVEKLMPGKLESILYDRSINKINEIKDLKNDLDGLINNINLEYKSIREEFNNFF